VGDERLHPLGMNYRRDVPVTTISRSRLLHREQTSRSRQPKRYLSCRPAPLISTAFAASIVTYFAPGSCVERFANPMNRRPNSRGLTRNVSS
jgi:hypothetical protein